MGDQRPRQRFGQSKPILLSIAALVAAAGIILAVRNQGDDAPDAVASPVLEDPASFAARLEEPDAFVINVHIPYEGEIGGTDAFIPFDEISGDGRLPEDRDTEILLYCRSGNMSGIASNTLAAAGYTNIVDLDGGMIAWEADGRPVVDSGPG